MRVEASCIYFARAVVARAIVALFCMNLPVWPHACQASSVAEESRKRGTERRTLRQKSTAAPERPLQNLAAWSPRVLEAWRAFKDASGPQEPGSNSANPHLEFLEFTT